MPSRAAIKSYAATFFVFTVVSGAVTFIYSKYSRPSDADMKNLSLRMTHDIERHTVKMQPAFNVRITNENDESPLRLQATIETRKPFSHIEYTWLLPEGVSIVGGANIRGTVATTNPRAPAVISATFVSESTENQQIHIRVTIHDGPRQMVQTAQFNTRDQKIIDENREILAERNREYVQAIEEQQ